MDVVSVDVVKVDLDDREARRQANFVRDVVRFQMLEKFLETGGADGEMLELGGDGGRLFLDLDEMNDGEAIAVQPGAAEREVGPGPGCMSRIFPYQSIIA
ncbi:MAG: hypothetical protein R3D28_04120 [Geminicoccaceae bacterium]